MYVDEWDAAWTIEFIGPLTVLTRVIELDEAPKDVLAWVLPGQPLTKDTLTEGGVAAYIPDGPKA